MGRSVVDNKIYNMERFEKRFSVLIVSPFFQRITSDYVRNHPPSYVSEMLNGRSDMNSVGAILLFLRFINHDEP